MPEAGYKALAEVLSGMFGTIGIILLISTIVAGVGTACVIIGAVKKHKILFRVGLIIAIIGGILIAYIVGRLLLSSMAYYLQW